MDLKKVIFESIKFKIQIQVSISYCNFIPIKVIVTNYGVAWSGLNSYDYRDFKPKNRGYRNIKQVISNGFRPFSAWEKTPEKGEAWKKSCKLLLLDTNCCRIWLYIRIHTRLSTVFEFQVPNLVYTFPSIFSTIKHFTNRSNS